MNWISYPLISKIDRTKYVHNHFHRVIRFYLFITISVPSVHRTVMTQQSGHWWSGVGPMDVSQAQPSHPPTTGPTARDGTSVHQLQAPAWLLTCTHPQAQGPQRGAHPGGGRPHTRGPVPSNLTAQLNTNISLASWALRGATRTCPPTVTATS